MDSVELIRAKIRELMPAGKTTLAHAAKSIGMSERTLQRRLAAHGQNYTRLLDETRFVKARELMLYQKKIIEIASELGYADTGSFCRAFERWTGMTATAYRRRFIHAAKSKWPQ